MYIKTFLPYTLSSCHESAKIALKDFLSCIGAIDSIMVLNRPPILTIGFTVIPVLVSAGLSTKYVEMWI